MKRPLVTLAITLALPGLALSLASCGGSEAGTSVIRVSAIPDDLKVEVAAMNQKLVDYLEAKTGLQVEFSPSSDYTAAVNGLLANKLDLVWLGGVTSVDADKGSDGKVTFVATRDIDLKFKSYFIANHQAIEAGKVRKLDQLSDLKPMAANLTFTFGSKKSTSGHIMPRHFLREAGIDPEQAFQSQPAYSGNHRATLQNVASGSVDVGALNFSTYDKADAALQEKAEIIYTTPFYVDYCWIGHDRLGKATLDKIEQALLALDPADPDHKVILDAWGAGRFVEARREQWDGIRKVLESLPKDF